MNINWSNVGKKARDVAIAAFNLALIWRFLQPSRKYGEYEARKHGNMTASYGEAVKAIVHSDMLDSYKRDVVGLLKTNGDVEYYESVISIVNSNMLDSYKKEMVKTLSEESE